MEQYENKDGVKFEIEIHSAKVATDADFFGYLFKVTLPEEEKDFCRIYKASVKKTFCPSKEESEKWLKNTALEFLKTILNTYQDGTTIMLVSPDYPDWILM